jgi:hypothetical protein
MLSGTAILRVSKGVALEQHLLPTWNRPRIASVGASMSTNRLPFLGALVLVAAACTPGAASPPSSSDAPGPSPSPATPAASPVTGGIEHPAGPSDIVLRYEEGGGFLMPSFLVTQAPIFTLYGDGTIVFRPAPPDVMPEPVNGVITDIPFRTARLSADQIQQLLEFAITEGGLGLASRDLYENPMVADAGTAKFTIRAGGMDKQFEVYALGIDAAGVPDKTLRASFLRLAERLRAIDQGGSLPSAEYAPEQYRGILMDGAGIQGAQPIAWPWPGIKVADFSMPGDEEGPAFPTRTMSPEEIAATGVTGGAGGFQGLLLDGPDGKQYSFAVRPLLPDETR